ncbi:hypothetical protein GH714_034538 [Hevea brasiliensis]|uniref:RING-type domain-containing protein n=1 Tax=Hevea brasiliensis TaxID=3981 RepID=A0A6A6NCX3_HEVBR|nr:hypothetical protein GH714_034538 [Hevea brasiliensis]
MDDTSSKPNSNTQSDQYPLLMERMNSHNDHEHIIDLTRNDDASSSSSHDGRPPEIDLPQHEDRSSGGASGPTHQISSSSLNELNSRSSAFTRRRDGYDHRRRSPLNSALWISIELFVTVGQIIASIVVVSLSRDENPQAPLFAWVVGYASGCVARLPILYWRFRNLPELNGLMNHFKMALDCFFAVWFVVGNVWIFGGYAMPFILCATICCCLPCIMSLLGIREDFSQTKGATVESINSLPTYKFKLQKSENVNDHDNAGTGEGGVLAAGTKKERAISGEDALCCICLNKYIDDDELRELPCSHVFHVDCVDKWFKINALCPLCKSDLGESSGAPPLARDPANTRAKENSR